MKRRAKQHTHTPTVKLSANSTVVAVPILRSLNVLFYYENIHTYIYSNSMYKYICTIGIYIYMRKYVFVITITCYY